MSELQGRGCDELRETKASLRNTQFLGIDGILQEVYRGFLPTSYTYNETDPEGGQVRME